MIERLKELLGAAGWASGSEPGESLLPETTLAAAALLVEAARLEEPFSHAEQSTIRRLLAERFGLDERDAAEALEEAARRQGESSELVRFTRVIKDRLPPGQRLAVIEMLWEVAYADGELHPYEANLVRRVAGLLYVTDRDSGAARKRVLERLGLHDALAGGDAP
jgi:uncharacterized tellurite resistance protein B-like protein